MTRAAQVAALQARLGHVFKDQALLMRALTHKSAGDGVRGFAHNERLEWLGDRVLGLLAAERLFRLDPKAEEGELTRRFNAVVNGRTCAQAARDLGVDTLMAVSKSVGGTAQGTRNESILGDAFEALLGALYLEGGLEAASIAFEAAWSLGLSGQGRDRNPKSSLQEWAQKRGRPAPAYAVLRREGPDHAPLFEVEVRVAGRAATAEGGSKQEAEERAARTLLTSGALDD
jgi:ribonuclease III